ncbi:MAG: hypothetical protein A2078_04970 [Nitrospirae bacterium GWC2_57_9]|nr:MAG: hypothetical protein A2078_04970 [Nitrospirae bacterium GWC2_57_9]
MPELAIGCSGFSYKHWKKVFYPADLPERKWLEYYSTVFSSVELNVTFYHLPSPAAFQSWYRDTPEGFTFAVKGSRYITHVKRLVDPAEPLKKFFEGANLLKEKMAVVLWQFPPSFKLNHPRFSAFLDRLERYPFRHAFEFRNESWIVSEVIDLCRDRGAALCMADSPQFNDDLPVTADFVYLRRHGQAASHEGSYSKGQLARDAARIRSYLKQGKDVFIYFNNDPHGYAPANARDLAALLA